jgi:hypothetical protein
VRTYVEHFENVSEHLSAKGRLKMQNTAGLARRMSRRTRQANVAKAIDITEINEGLQSTAAYIAELSGELAMAGGARFANLAHLLAQAQLEAELCSRPSR